ncbi:MAG: fructose-1,6-bisphosphatase, partial [Fusobacteriaceae bacterium]
FLTDIHGEYDAFNHVLRNCSGVIKNKIEDIFKDTISDKEKKQLATVIYYPAEKIEMIRKNYPKHGNINDWYLTTIERLMKILRIVSSKYTSSKVKKALPKEFSYIIQELIHEKESIANNKEYVKNIISTIVETDTSKRFIVAIANLIQRLTIDRLHIIGDIFDRGPAPHKILDTLIDYHNVDIQWGNHDILWMGAVAGQLGSVANVVRICLRYGNTDLLEDIYGINILPLATFAMEKYSDDDCSEFIPKNTGQYSDKNEKILAKMHKAISIIQFKIESQIIKRNPEYSMQDRLLFEKINWEEKTIEVDGEKYELNSFNFPTIDKNNPDKLSEEEEEVLYRLQLGFANSDKLRKHIEFLFSKGNIYLVCNSNLLYHGCVPMKSSGEFDELDIFGKKISCKKYFDFCDQIVREAFFDKNDEKKSDFFWYLWCGEKSPLFGKDKMRTFERYFIADKKPHKEIKNPYYSFYDNENIFTEIMQDFGLNGNESHIINGHVPVKVCKGELPVKANKKLLLIDGGFSKAYQKETGIAGYTLIYNSHGLKLVSHEPFG